MDKERYYTINNSISVFTQKHVIVDSGRCATIMYGNNGPVDWEINTDHIEVRNITNSYETNARICIRLLKYITPILMVLERYENITLNIR